MDDLFLSDVLYPDCIVTMSFFVGVRQGLLSMENCVLQCETTGVIVRTSSHLLMKMCDLYGSKVSTDIYIYNMLN